MSKELEDIIKFYFPMLRNRGRVDKHIEMMTKELRDYDVKREDEIKELKKIILTAIKLMREFKGDERVYEYLISKAEYT